MGMFTYPSARGGAGNTRRTKEIYPQKHEHPRRGTRALKCFRTPSAYHKSHFFHSPHKKPVAPTRPPGPSWEPLKCCSASHPEGPQRSPQTGRARSDLRFPEQAPHRHAAPCVLPSRPRLLHLQSRGRLLQLTSTPPQYKTCLHGAFRLGFHITRRASKPPTRRAQRRQERSEPCGIGASCPLTRLAATTQDRLARVGDERGHPIKLRLRIR
jgi:hypothetical protein